eukprot:6185579-Pleurochrysis_carterae.AAC.1
MFSFVPKDRRTFLCEYMRPGTQAHANIHARKHTRTFMHASARAKNLTHAHVSICTHTCTATHASPTHAPNRRNAVARARTKYSH